MDKGALFGVAIVMIVIVAVYLTAHFVRTSPFVPAVQRVQYGTRVRPVIDPQTIIEETLPEGREGILYREKYATPDRFEKQNKFFEMVAGGIDLPNSPLLAPKPRIQTFLSGGITLPQPAVMTYNGKTVNSNMMETSGFGPVDTTPDPGLANLSYKHPLRRAMARPANYILKDPLTSLQKRAGLRYYMEVKKGDRIVPPSFGGA